MLTNHAPRPTLGRAPWFQAHPHLAIAVAVAIYGIVFVLRFEISSATQAFGLLYMLPIALLGFTFGRNVGLLAGAIGVGLLAVWVLVSDVPMTPLEWLTHVVPMPLLGVLVGSAADRQRSAVAVERRLIEAEARQRDAAEINDEIIQRLAVAKWVLESGNTDKGLALLTETIETAEALVVELLSTDEHRDALHTRGTVDHAH